MVGNGKLDSGNGRNGKENDFRIWRETGISKVHSLSPIKKPFKEFGHHKKQQDDFFFLEIGVGEREE